MYFIPRLSEKIGDRRNIAVITYLLGAVGIAISGFADNIPLIAIIALCVAAAGHLAVQPLYWTFPSGYLGGTAAASGIALINSIGNLGGFVAPNIRVWAESTFQSAKAGLYLLAIITVIGAIMIFFLKKMGIDKNNN